MGVNFLLVDNIIEHTERRNGSYYALSDAIAFKYCGRIN